MTVDENAFFREATLLMCGNLDIERALVELLGYLRKFMPADRLILERLGEEGNLQSIISVTPEAGERMKPAPLSSTIRSEIEEMYRQGVPAPYFQNNPNKDGMSKDLLDFYQLRASAFIGLPLGTRDHEPGGVMVLTEEGQYDDAQLQLISLLKAPFEVAMHNALQHAEIVELKDELAAENKVLLAQHTHTYLSLRRAVGWIGILLPFTLILGNYFVFGGDIIMRSISRYYYSSMRNVFVGALSAMAVFMFYYSGYGRRDRWAGILTGFLTVGVVIFPTTLIKPSDWVGLVHYVSAGSLFLVLAWISLFHFPKKRPGVEKRATDKIQVLCGLIMIACVFSTVVYFLFFRVEGVETSFLFVAEAVALIAFGVSWLTEGLDLKRELVRLS